jgi:CheY-like chemotaxis protein
MDESHQNYKDVNNIIQGGKRAENLVRQLLAFSSRQMIQPKIININTVITELHTMLSRLIEEDIKFDLKLREDLGNIKADPVQIQQVLVNLVVNAGHAIKEQKDKDKRKIIRISTDSIKLSSEFVDLHPGSREGDFILITVEDTGIGMSDKTRQRIFEPFFSTKSKGEGTGLGLSTVYGIIKQNNSNIYVDSEPGKGTAFRIYWPVSKEEKSDEARIETQLDIGPRTETILYVEDDIHVRDMAVDALKTFGYKVFEAENGRHALDIIKKEYLIDKIDLVISDIVMPEMSGEELAETIRKLNPKIQILLCSGYTNSRIYIRENFNLNGCHFLAKPFTMQKLEKKIRSILQQPKE